MKYLIWPILAIVIVIRYFLLLPVYHNEDFVRVSGRVNHDPARYSTSQGIKIAGLKVFLPLFPEIFYGDYLILEGVVDKEVLKNPKVIFLRQENSGVWKLRKTIITFYQKILPEPEAGLLAGIVLGSKSTLDPDFYNKTKLSGLAHVVVASGTNISFVASFLFGIATFYLSRKKAIYIVILGILLYLFLSGFEAPLIRAGMMSLIIFIGQSAGRVLVTWRIFFLTAGIMLAINPFWVTDLGFVLSFASTSGLLLFSQRLTEKLDKWPVIFKESFSTTLSAQVMVSPILFLVFGHISIWSIATNLLILWTVPPLMLLGAAGGFIGLIFEPFGRIILYLSYPMLWWFCRVVEFFAGLS